MLRGLLLWVVLGLGLGGDVICPRSLLLLLLLLLPGGICAQLDRTSSS